MSFDVIDWLAENDIPLSRLDYQGRAKGRAISVIGGTGYAADLEKVQWQTEIRNDPKRRAMFCRDLIVRKLTATLKTLAEVIPDTQARSVAMVAAEAAINRLRTEDCRDVDKLRMVEAVAAARYFAAWKGLPLIWRSRWKYPVPEEWQTIAQRSSVAKAGYTSNRNAKHPVNAMLNYAYGILYADVHIRSVAEGYDPRRGIMHHDREDQGAFPWVYDMIEPRRPEVDAAILKFALSTPFTGADFVVASSGICRLAPQLAKLVASLTIQSLS